MYQEIGQEIDLQKVQEKDQDGGGGEGEGDSNRIGSGGVGGVVARGWDWALWWWTHVMEKRVGFSGASEGSDCGTLSVADIVDITAHVRTAAVGFLFFLPFFFSSFQKFFPSFQKSYFILSKIFLYFFWGGDGEGVHAPARGIVYSTPQ